MDVRQRFSRTIAETVEKLLQLGLRYPVVVACLLGLAVSSVALILGPGMDDLAQQRHLEAYLEAVSNPAGAEHGPMLDPYGMPDAFRLLDNRPGAQPAVYASDALPWWTSEGARALWWRPLSSLLALFDVWVAGRSTWFAHLHSSLWYWALIVVAAAVFRQIYGRSSPEVWVLALALFAIDDAHNVVTWTAGRNAVVSLTFALGSLWLHIRGRRRGQLRWLGFAVIAACASLLAGESGVAGLAYILAYELVLAPGGRARRCLSLLPYIVVGFIWLWHHGLHGFGVLGLGAYFDPIAETASWISRFPSHLLVMFSGLMGPVTPGLYMFPELRGLSLALAAAVGLWTVWAVRWLWGRLPVARRSVLNWLLIGSLLALLPASFALPNSRSHFAASFGCSVLIAELLLGFVQAGSFNRADANNRFVRHRSRAMYALGIVVHMVLAPLQWWVFALGMHVNIDRALVRAAEADVLDTLHDDALVIVPVVPDTGWLLMGSARPYLRRAIPKRFQVLSLADCEHQLHRTSPRTFVLKTLGCGNLLPGPPGEFFRSPADPLTVGTVVKRRGYSIEVLATEVPGQPSMIRLVLTEPSLGNVQWLVPEAGQLQPLPPLSVGERRRLRVEAESS